MKVLILDSRVIYELAITRNINQSIIRNIVDNLSEQYELRVSYLIKNYLEGLSSVISEEKINNIIHVFSNFFFYIDEDLIAEFKTSNVTDIYSAIEASYARTREEAFIVTTVPESFKGSGVFICSHLDYSSKLNDIRNLIESDINLVTPSKINNRSSTYKNSNYYNNIIQFIRKKEVKFNNSFEKFRETVRQNQLKKAYIIQIFNEERECIQTEINFKSYQYNLRKSMNSSGYYFQISQILINMNSHIFKSIKSNRISQTEYNSLKMYSDNYGFTDILNSGGISARTYNSI